MCSPAPITATVCCRILGSKRISFTIANCGVSCEAEALPKHGTPWVLMGRVVLTDARVAVFWHVELREFSIRGLAERIQISAERDLDKRGKDSAGPGKALR